MDGQHFIAPVFKATMIFAKLYSRRVLRRMHRTEIWPRHFIICVGKLLFASSIVRATRNTSTRSRGARPVKLILRQIIQFKKKKHQRLPVNQCTSILY